MPKTKREIAREVDEIIAKTSATRGGLAPRTPRSSVRLIRSRQAALRDYRRLLAAVPEGPRGDETARWFVDGFEFVRRDVLAGCDPEQAYDLSTSVRGAPAAFHDGAGSARNLYNSQRPELVEGIPRSRELAEAELAQALRVAKAYNVRLPT